MHIVVLGAGVVGITTAYFLTRSGHQVTVIDGATHVAAGASYANGGQLSYSFTDALANPAFLAKLPRYILGADPAVRIARWLDPKLLKWSSAFVRQCTSRRARKNSLAALTLALRSSSLLEQLMQDVTLEFSFKRAGKLVLVRDPKSLARADRSCQVKRQHGCETSVISMADARILEPQLNHFSGRYAGAVYSENDEVADAHAFTEGLANWLLKHQSVTLKLSTEVRSICHQNGNVTGVQTKDGTFSADAIVVCTGASSEALLTPLDLSSDIYPVRGYSVTLPLGSNPPEVSLTDFENKIVFSRLKNRLRVAGFADFVGFESNRDTERISTLVAIAKTIAPQAASFDEKTESGWGGLRPMTPDGLPRVGPTRVRNLFLNTGHGMFGWTLACASGYDLSTAIDSYYN